MTENTRESRPDLTHQEVGDQPHVDGVVDAANGGRMSRKQADAVIKAGEKAVASHNMSRSLRG